MTKRWSMLAAAMAACLLVAPLAPTHPAMVAFTATGFTNLIDANPAPEDPVNGVIVYDAASPNAPIDSLISISLSIAGHAYGLSDIGFLSDSGVGYVGGLIDGVLGSGNFENDFLLVWDMAALVPLDFLYAVEGNSGIWDMPVFARFTVTDSAVPVPATVLLLTIGFLALTVARSSALRRART